METEEVSDRFVALCFVNGLEAYDGNKVVKKEFIVALRGKIYFVKFIINPEEDDVKPGVSFGRSFLRMTKPIIDFMVGTITIYHDINPFLEETKQEEKSNDDWDHLLNFNINDIPLLGKEGLLPFLMKNGKSSRNKKWKDKVELDGMIVKEEKEEEEVKRIKGEALKEKDDPRTFIFPIRLEGQVNKNALVDTGSDINTMPYRIYERLGREDMKKRLFSTFDGFCHQTFRSARCDVMRNAESNSDDEEDYQIKRNKLWEHTMMRPDHHDPNALDNMKPWRKYCFHKFTINFCYRKVVGKKLSYVKLDMMRRYSLLLRGLELLISMNQSIRSFAMNFICTYEFDEVCADDELQTKKIIKVRLGGRAHSLTLLEFACRLGLYQAAELDEEGFNVYFKGGLHSDEHFNAQEYWLSISQEENLNLSRSHASTIRYPVLRVIYKMITYGFCQRTTGNDKIQKNDLWLLSMFHAKHQNRYENVAWLIARWMKRKGAEDVLRSLSAPVYCRDLDTTTLRELIEFESRLIPEDPQPGVPRVGIPRPPRASTQDLYNRMGRIEIRQEAIERMEYR
uniref:Reverse transcriptase domain-containing protein n=1 Tax=Tanacetum cinerariifolium TaxID=118510 RepID=A0A6L2LXX7_TANCI|nr:hypothetical protein [Tanacetum cinerariifolium]